MAIGNEGGVVPPNTESNRRLLKRYQLIWRPSFLSKNSVSYVLSENLKVNTLGTRDTVFDRGILLETVNVQDLIDLALENELIIPFNTNIALAQEYMPSLKNKVVTYETIGGNSITTFGEAIKQIGLKIRIIKLSYEWELYYKGLEAISYLSSNQSRYYGGLYLNGYDSFSEDNFVVSNRYKVTVQSLDFSFRSDTNTTVSADLRMFVNQDFTRSSAGVTKFSGSWGRL